MIARERMGRDLGEIWPLYTVFRGNSNLGIPLYLAWISGSMGRLGLGGWGFNWMGPEEVGEH